MLLLGTHPNGVYRARWFLVHDAKVNTIFHGYMVLKVAVPYYPVISRIIL